MNLFTLLVQEFQLAGQHAKHAMQHKIMANMAKTVIPPSVDTFRMFSTKYNFTYCTLKYYFEVLVLYF